VSLLAGLRLSVTYPDQVRAQAVVTSSHHHHHRHHHHGT